MNVNYHYTHLGLVPSVARPEAERRDALLARTGPAARAVLARINRLPRRKRVAALDRVLSNFDPGLPTRVRRVAEHLHSQGIGVNQAMERALALSLADASIERIKKIGRAYRKGVVLPMGQLGAESSEMTEEEQSAGDVVAGMFQGVICSDGLQTSISEMVGRNEGREAYDATNTGYEVAQGFAQCATLQPPATPTTPVPEPQDETSLAVPVAVGVGALALAGGVVWFATRKN